MKVYTITQARRNFSQVLDRSKNEKVIIRHDGTDFVISPRKQARSPLDVPSIKTTATTEDILAAIREGRSRTR